MNLWRRNKWINKILLIFLTLWMEYIRKEQAMTLLMNVSYLPDASKEYRQGRADGLSVAKSILGLLAFEHGIDLTKILSNELLEESFKEKVAVSMDSIAKQSMASINQIKPKKGDIWFVKINENEEIKEIKIDFMEMPSLHLNM